ncbi:MAG: exodeoxyribonuclease III [Cytophagales bacterium]|nr:exodeoxyribonuclease III [Cytophagales bacterium]
MHIVSWNVNGVRAIVKKDFVKDINKVDPDILCLQETKANPEEVKTALLLLPQYKVYANSSKAKKGYSGTAVLTKKEPNEITYDMGLEEHDQEGRVITAEFDSFYLVTVYTPNSGDGLKRLDYRKDWDAAFKNHVQALDEKKPVIVCGDLNVAHTDIDLARPKPNYNKNPGFTQDEIDGLENTLSVGFLDTFRHFFPDEIKYSWWSYRFGARDRNVGWRIDYFLVSERFIDQLTGADIYNEVFGSDHCPVAVKLK